MQNARSRRHDYTETEIRRKKKKQELEVKSWRHFFIRCHVLLFIIAAVVWIRRQFMPAGGGRDVRIAAVELCNEICPGTQREK